MSGEWNAMVVMRMVVRMLGCIEESFAHMYTFACIRNSVHTVEKRFVPSNMLVLAGEPTHVGVSKEQAWKTQRGSGNGNKRLEM